MKTWNRIILYAKVDKKVTGETKTGLDYMTISVLTEKTVKDSVFKTYYQCMIWDENKIKECKAIKVGDMVLINGVYDPSNYKVQDTKLDNGKDYYKQSNNINVSSIEKLPIGEQEQEQEQEEEQDPIAKVKKKHSNIESSLSDDLDDEIPF